MQPNMFVFFFSTIQFGPTHLRYVQAFYPQPVKVCWVLHTMWHHMSRQRKGVLHLIQHAFNNCVCRSYSVRVVVRAKNNSIPRWLPLALLFELTFVSHSQAGVLIIKSVLWSPRLVVIVYLRAPRLHTHMCCNRACVTTPVTSGLNGDTQS